MSIVSQITKLKKFGIFHDINWNTELPNFKRFNLLYGWNRCGKTTLSRVFASCEKKSVYDELNFRQYPENGEFEIKTSDGYTLKSLDVSSNVLPIKVFNQDFIDDNISFDPSDSCNAIVYVSEEDIESKKRLDKLKLDKIDLGKTYEQSKKDKLAKEERKNAFLTGLGREIANILFDKSYNKTKVESKINSIGIDNFSDKSLSDEDKKKYEAISKSEAGNIHNNIQEYLFSFKINDDDLNNYQQVFDKLEILLSKKVVAETLERLKEDTVLNNWVKQGFELHKSKEEVENCLFCQKPLDKDFLSILSKHFSKDYENLQDIITCFKTELLNLKSSEIDSTSINLYPDLKDTYILKVNELNEVSKTINAWIDVAVKALEEKYENPLSKVNCPARPPDFLFLYKNKLDEVNNIIEKQNEKTKNHSTEVSIAREKLELNSISIALNGIDYKKLCVEITEANKKDKEALEAFNQNGGSIIELEKKTSNIGKAIIAINKHLNEFFGRNEIELVIDESNKGYIIKRDGVPAKNLSEGEKTAIAFSYFVVKVGEGDFDLSKGIIFIDDPISSLDSNFIFHCFSLIKNHFNQVGQLFISTHNFQLFNLVKDWFVRKNRNMEEENNVKKLKGNPGRELPCEFYMIKPVLNESVRRSKLSALDSTLKDYKSEYSFLFSILNEFINKPEEPTFEEMYNIANIGRRFLDIYADFKIPTNKKEQKEKIEIIVNEINKTKEKEEDKITSVESEKIFWLLNWYSHNYDPTSTIEHKDKSESKDAIRILLKIVKDSDPKHYEILLKS